MTEVELNLAGLPGRAGDPGPITTTPVPGRHPRSHTSSPRAVTFFAETIAADIQIK